jgi:chromosome segregation ATPase
MSFTIALIADVLVGVLLVATIGACIVLSRRIERLKADEGALRRTIGDLVAATDNAERAIGGLKGTLSEADKTLAERLRTAERYAADLASQIAAGEQVLARIAQIVEASRLMAPQPANAEVEARSEQQRRLAEAAERAAAITQRAVARLDGQAA